MAKKKTVHFNDDIQLIEEPPELSDVLKEARLPEMSSIDRIMRQLDKLKMEILLSPVLDKQHRLDIQIKNNLV